MIEPHSLLEHARTWRHRSMSALVALLVTVIFVIPVVVPPGPASRLLGELLFTLTLAAGLAVVAPRREVLVGLAIACFLAVALRVVEWFMPGTLGPVLRDGSALLALAALAALIAARVFAGGSVTTDVIMGAVALYLMLAIVWAGAYELLYNVDPKAFVVQAGTTTDHAPWVYFSLVTLTTVGYGDITPVTRAARSLATLEALVGQLYPAIVLARLVGSVQIER